MTPERPATEQGRVADVPCVSNKHQALETADRTAIIELHSRLMPAIRRRGALINRALGSGDQQQAKEQSGEQKQSSDQQDRAPKNACQLADGVLLPLHHLSLSYVA